MTDAAKETPPVEAVTDTPPVEAVTDTPPAEAVTEAPTVEAVTEAPTVEAVPDLGDADADGATTARSHEPLACPVAWCPVCMAVTAVQPLKPEAIEHLLKAGTEFFLAVKAVIDTRAEQLDPPDEKPGPTRFEKIDLG